MDTEVHERVTRFRTDLTAGPISDVVRKHITTGEPVAVSPEVYYDLRRQISTKFGVHPSTVVLVGSCRLGFSLKQKKHGRYTPVSVDSDVDVAIVSETLFDWYWNQVFDVVQEDRNWASNEGKRFTNDLFCGWLSPHTLPNRPRFAAARGFAEFFARLSQERICGYRSVSARLYRTWDRLEAYQKILVRECLNELGRPA